MTLVRLDVRFDDLGALADYGNAHHVIVSVIDADTIVALSSLHDELKDPIGVWLELSADYPAQMAARDVKTLSWLATLDTVVVLSLIHIYLCRVVGREFQPHADGSL